MWDALVAIVTALVPPRDTNPAVNRYRAAVSSILVVTFMAVSLQIARTLGLLGFVGVSGFADADVVKEISNQVREVQVAQFDSKILQDRERQCKLDAKNYDAREMMVQRLQWELNEYKKLSGNEYQLPACDQF